MTNPPPGGGSSPPSRNDKNVVVIVKPTNKDIIYAPEKIARLLSNSLFSQHVIDTKVNKRKGLIVVEVDGEYDAGTIEEVTLIGGIEVQCSIREPPPEVRYGVIHPVSTHSKLEDIREMIRVKDDCDSEIKVANIERLTKKAGLEIKETQSLKVTFLGNTLPRGVTIGYSYYKVSPFVRPPLQCYNCQRMGHTKDNCNASTRCMLCSGLHNKDDCTVTDPGDHKCANCRGNHRANDPICAYYRQGKEVEVIRSTNNIRMSYQQAKNVLNNRNTRSEGEYSGTYANAIISGQSPAPERSTSTSYAMSNPKPTNEQNKPVFTTKDFNATLKCCLMAILAEILPNNITDKTNLESVVTDKVNSHFSKRKMSDSSSDEAVESHNEENQYEWSIVSSKNVSKKPKTDHTLSPSRSQPSTSKSRSNNENSGNSKSNYRRSDERQLEKGQSYKSQDKKSGTSHSKPTDVPKSKSSQRDSKHKSSSSQTSYKK